jgi:hypothetical protein
VSQYDFNFHFKESQMDQYNEGYTTELFKNRTAAEKAYQAALDKGYSDKDINVIMSEDSKNKYYDSELVDEDTQALEGAGVGGTVGAAVGGIIGAIAAIGTNLVLPGLGLVVAGPLAAGLAGAGAGGITGGVVGALVGWGIPEEEARRYEKGINDGGIVLAVKNRDSKSDLADDWRTYN